jgi:hypothetical protein
MELSIRFVTRPLPGTVIKTVVVVIVIVAVVVVWRAGCGLDTAIPLILGAGLAGARVARALFAPALPAACEAGDAEGAS